MIARILPIGLLLVILALYHSGGLQFLYWADSHGYLSQGISIIREGGYERSGGRSLGYPLFLTLPLSLPASALALVALQAGSCVAAYGVIYRTLARGADRLAPRSRAVARAFVRWLPLWLTATAAYSALHVFALSLLPEILFATLALFGVAAVGRFMLVEALDARTYIWAALASALAVAPMTVKPHWLLAGPALVLLVAIKLLLLSWPRPWFGAIGRSAAAILVPLAAASAILAPDRLLAERDPEAALFGPRALFCMHAHMIDDAFARDRSLRFDPDPSRDTGLREAIHDLRSRDKAPWKVLGINGDHCFYDAPFQDRLKTLLPSGERQRAFFANAYLEAVKAAPARFAALLLRQIALGVEVSFQRFAMNQGLDPAIYEGSSKAARLDPSFLRGVELGGEAGPFNSRLTMKSTVAGWAVQGALAAFFFSLGAVYAILILVSAIVPVCAWRGWDGRRRRVFVAYIGVPLVATLAHHTLVGIAHTFDIWRYGFNVFFVNIAFTAAAALFWLDEARARRRLTSQSQA